MEIALSQETNKISIINGGLKYVRCFLVLSRLQQWNNIDLKDIHKINLKTQ